MAEKIKDVKDLDVYQKAYKASLEIHKLSLKFPKEEQFALASQIRSSSKSICANLAEGFGRQVHSKQDFKRYLGIAIGSADETKVWLDYCKDLGYLESDKHLSLSKEYKDLARMLTGLYRNWG